MSQVLMLALSILAATGCDQDPAFKIETVVPAEQAKDGQDAGNQAVNRLGKRKDSDQKEITQVFNSHQLQQESGELSLDSLFVKQNITMDLNTSKQGVLKSQISRPYNESTHKQGKLGKAVQERFIQKSNRNLDILIVIDNSRSMAEEQQNLASKLDPLLNYVQDTLWRIAITTTDNRYACIRDVISYSDDPSQIYNRFHRAISAGIRGSGTERGVQAAVNALSTKCNYKPWYRDRSTLAILFVSDEDNCSDGTECGWRPDSNPQILIDFLKTKRHPGLDARIYGIIWHPSESREQCTTGENIGNQYSWLVDKTSGTWGSICSPDYSEVLTQMSKHLAGVMQSSFALKHTPDEGSIRVKIDGITQEGGFYNRGNILSFKRIPRENAAISVNYKYATTPMKTNFKVAHAFDAKSVSVIVNGKKFADDSFSVKGDQISFNRMPPPQADIVIGYRSPEALPRQFKLDIDFRNSRNIHALVADTPREFKWISRARGIISFETAPRDEEVVKVVYENILGPKYEYEISIVGENETLEVYDLDHGEPIFFTRTQGGIKVSQDEFFEGRQIVASSRNPHRTYEIELEYEPITIDSLTIGGINCSKKKYQITDKMLNIQDCEGALEYEKAEITYSYYKDLKGQFPFPLPKNIDSELLEFFVEVAGKPVENFEYKDGMIQLRKPLPEYPAKVKISLNYYEQQKVAQSP